ncbi:MAG: YwaF family protein [Ignavibacteria bacterium]|nr:YwaF family protein [Ignavibacteria bacterium]
MQLQWYYFASFIFVAFTLWIFKNKNQNQRFRFLMVLTAINALAYVINWTYFYIRSDHIFTLLPLQLCNLAVFLIPIALITKKAVIMDFVFYVCGLAALVAILVVGSDYQDTYSMMTLSFYVFHFSIFLIPMLNSVWGFHSLKPNRKSALDLTIMVLAISFSLHLFNLLLNNVLDIPANYFFTIKYLSAPSNPAFALFASWIPYDYIYLSVAFPILYLYMFLIYLFMRLTSKFKSLSSIIK